jgi:hypothetical protein
MRRDARAQLLGEAPSEPGFPGSPRLQRQPPLISPFERLIICEVIGDRQTKNARRERATLFRASIGRTNSIDVTPWASQRGKPRFGPSLPTRSFDCLL